MKGLTFYIVDVFAEEKFAGNQLAVVRNAKNLSDGEMLKIAKEMNYSETSFILSDESNNGGYDVRIFTPEEEVPFAGHPTLGTAYIIKHEIIKNDVDKIILNLKVGQIPVTFTNKDKAQILWMKQIQPTFGAIFDEEKMAQVLNLDVNDIDARFSIQEVSTGLPFIIVPLKSLESVKKTKIHSEKFFELIENIDSKAILVFCTETYNSQNDLNVRVFSTIPEDPATGSANGCLAGYLVKYQYLNSNDINLRVEQGYEIGRPSLLLLQASEENGSYNISVGGGVIMVAKGELI